MLAVPAGGINVGLKRLRKKGQKELIRWVNQGGRLIGWRYGAARLAYVLGMSRARYDYLTGEHRRSHGEGPGGPGQPVGRGRRPQPSGRWWIPQP